MLLTMIATLCLAGVCTEKVVTDQATPLECIGPRGEQNISGWMLENGYLARGYRLARWGCVRVKKIPT